MEREYIGLLKSYIEKTLGRRVLSSTDCRYLYNDITQQLDSTISFNTLRRFFNLMETKHEQSTYTLDILSAYCGFSSFDEFTTVAKQKPAETNSDSIQHADLQFYLVMLFKETEVTDANDFTFSRFVRQTINFLEYYPALIDKFQREIAKTKNGQIFYFEQFINIDRLNSFYGDGLRYYLHENKSIEAQLFGNYLLCFRYWLTMDYKDLEKHYHTITQLDINKKIQPATAACFYAAQLLYANAVGNDAEAIMIKTRQYYATITLSKENCPSALKYYFTISQALLLTGQYEEAQFYIDEFLKNKKKFSFVAEDSTLIESIHLFKAITLVYAGERTAAKKALDNINTCNFFFLSKQYMTILYLSTKQQLKKSSYEQKQLQYLVKSTGFVKLMDHTLVDLKES
jgi:tetratricopeptide (TPR) repeat protein